MKTLARISNEEYDPLSLGLSATAEISILGDQAFIILPKVFGEVAGKIGLGFGCGHDCRQVYAG